MKSLKILTVAALSSLIALTSAADISLSGDGRYHFGIKTADGKDSNYRSGRLRMTVTGGSETAGVQARIRTNMGDSDTVTLDTTVNPNTVSETASIYADYRKAWVNLGALTLVFGEDGKYTGLLGTYYGGGEFSAVSSVKAVYATPSFGGWLAHETGDWDAGNGNTAKSDYVHYGLFGEIQGIGFNYVARPSNLVRGNDASTIGTWGFAPFQDLTLTANLGGSTVELNTARSDAPNSDALMARVSVPVNGLTVKLGYAKLEGGYKNEDGSALLGEGILTGSHSQDVIGGSGNAEDANLYTGLAVAGSMGNISYQVTGGTYDDSDDTTSNGFYALDTSYSLDAATTLRFRMGKAVGKKGMGVEVNYAF